MILFYGESKIYKKLNNVILEDQNDLLSLITDYHWKCGDRCLVNRYCMLFL